MIGINVNNELVVLKVLKEGDLIWFNFDDDHQDPDLHTLICKRVDSFKLKKAGSTKQFDHYFTEQEYKSYMNSDGKLKFDGAPKISYFFPLKVWMLFISQVEHTRMLILINSCSSKQMIAQINRYTSITCNADISKMQTIFNKDSLYM